MPRGLNVEPLTEWLSTHLPAFRPPARFQLFEAGGSNLTYLIQDDEERRWVLRRPPEGRRLATAHDVNREVRVLRALVDTATVPTPEVQAYCEDESILGAPFFVMTFVDGFVLRDRQDASQWDAPACRRATESLIEAQTALHAIDVDAIGLGDFAKRENYVERQIARWSRQAERSSTRPLPLLEEVRDLLMSHRPPESGEVSLVHGDYRFDNTVLGQNQNIAGVLDWELCTLGDPVADFCWSLLYWADPTDEYSFLASPPTLHPAFPRRDEVAELYARKSGRNLDTLTFFSAFGWWKMACIVEGVYTRLQTGSGGGMKTTDLAAVAERTERLLEIAARWARRL